MHRDELPIAEPCHADWNAMSGDQRKRFCGSCTKHVHDLSAMTEPEAVDLLHTMQNLCVRYAVAPDGRILHAPPPRPSRFPRLVALGVALFGSVPAFASGAVAQPSPSEPSLVDRLVRRAQAAVGIVPEAQAEAEFEMGDIAPPEPPPPPRPPMVLMGAPPPLTVPLPREVVRPPVTPPTIPTPAPGETVIPEVEEALVRQR